MKRSGLEPERAGEHHRTWAVAVAAWLLAFGSLTLSGANPPAQLSATRELPFRTPARGVNYYDLFVRQLKPGAAVGVPTRFAWLATNGASFVRFSAGGYWPSEWGLYQTNRAEHWRRLDAVVHAAETNRVGLVPSLFWFLSTVPDLVGEPVSAWGDTNSQTLRFLRQYTREVVTRYRESPAIWMWELGNEYNLVADLPNAAEHRPPVVAELGTPRERSARDELTHSMIRTALREFALEVRRHDARRPITSGHAFPRPSAWHQERERSWKADTEEQFASMLAADHPDPVNVISLRLYGEDDARRLEWATRAARKLGKPLFVGEFGVPGPNVPANREKFDRWLKLIGSAEVALSAVWVFDFDAQDREWNVTPENERAWQLLFLKGK